MKKFFIMLFVLFVVLTHSPLCFAQMTDALPEIGGWINGELRKTVFDTVSGSRGYWLERDYRSSDGIPFHAVWMEGSGDKGWSPAEKPLSSDDGSLGSGATYRTFPILGQRSALEHHPVTGYSLSVKAEKKGTLTLESLIATEDEIISAAERLLAEILR